MLPDASALGVVSRRRLVSGAHLLSRHSTLGRAHSQQLGLSSPSKRLTPNFVQKNRFKVSIGCEGFSLASTQKHTCVIWVMHT